MYYYRILNELLTSFKKAHFRELISRSVSVGFFKLLELYTQIASTVCSSKLRIEEGWSQEVQVHEVLPCTVFIVVKYLK